MKTVYIAMSADRITPGHVSIIQEAGTMDEVVAGLLSPMPGITATALRRVIREVGTTTQGVRAPRWGIDRAPLRRSNHRL